VEQVGHPPVEFGREQCFTGFEEVAKPLDLPESRIIRNPLGREGAGVVPFNLREVLLRQSIC
jgi:hypothetical protein